MEPLGFPFSPVIAGGLINAAESLALEVSAETGASSKPPVWRPCVVGESAASQQ